MADARLKFLLPPLNTFLLPPLNTDLILILNFAIDYLHLVFYNLHGTFVKITTLLSYKNGYLSAEHFNFLYIIA